jgi:TPR repeat protein
MSSTILAADLEAGVWAIKDRDYPKALEELRPLAEQGNPEAQDWLGWMYLAGNGLSKDYAQATHWFNESASQGYAKAEFHLGLFVYANGCRSGCGSL